ncbi:hypothetical protein [Bavariicoccus seileri]|uniref:hypothetical protein n=1 Tax=Bavariicoccus seileri TaxID=549685 RepID=UPI0003B55390|nr:hypothetical protein [Bavariicoccus seileri]
MGIRVPKHNNTLLTLYRDNTMIASFFYVLFYKRQILIYFLFLNVYGASSRLEQLVLTTLFTVLTGGGRLFLS